MVAIIILLSIFRTILLSVISLLNEPNTFSPANVDASIMFRKWQESKGRDKEYEQIIKYVCGFLSPPTSGVRLMVFGVSFTGDCRLSNIRPNGDTH